MYTSTTYLPSLVQIGSAVKKCKKCQILRETQNPDPDPDPKAEHNPDAPPLGEHCAQVWFKSIQPSRRSSVLSVSHIFCSQIRILIRIQKLSTPQMPPHQGSIVPKFGSIPSNRLGGVAFCVYHILSHFFGSQIRSVSKNGVTHIFMYTCTTYLPSLVQIRSAVKKCKKCQILRQTWNPNPDPDTKVEHNPDTPHQGSIVSKFKSIQPSRRSSIFSQLWTTDATV